MASPTLLEIAEAPGAMVTPPHPRVVFGDGWVFVPAMPTLGAVQQIRLTPDRVEAAREEIRAVAAGHDLPEVGWWQSPLSEPPDVGARLGLEHRETLTVVTLDHAVDDPAAFEVREVETLDDYIAAQTIDAIANGWPVWTDREGQEAMWRSTGDRFVLWLALDEGRPIGMARCAIAPDAMLMIGGSVLPEARGRGAYRTLVAERWRATEARGLRALVTTANDQSRPILERVGFDRIGEIEIWVDRV